MSVLSDRDILTALASGEISIAPFDAVDVQPASVDLHLDGTFRVFRNIRDGFIDPRGEQTRPHRDRARCRWRAVHAAPR